MQAIQKRRPLVCRQVRILSGIVAVAVIYLAGISYLSHVASGHWPFLSCCLESNRQRRRPTTNVWSCGNNTKATRGVENLRQGLWLTQETSAFVPSPVPDFSLVSYDGLDLLGRGLPFALDFVSSRAVQSNGQQGK